MKKFRLIMLTKLTGHRASGQGTFWPHWHIVNVLGRGPLADATYQILSSRSSGFRQENFLKSFPFITRKITTGNHNCKCCLPYKAL